MESCVSAWAVMQEAALFGDLTLLENLEYTCRLKQPVTTTAHQVLLLLHQHTSD